jgi:hypothetical protein
VLTVAIAFHMLTFHMYYGRHISLDVAYKYVIMYRNTSECDIKRLFPGNARRFHQYARHSRSDTEVMYRFSVRLLLSHDAVWAGMNCGNTFRYVEKSGSLRIMRRSEPRNP